MAPRSFSIHSLSSAYFTESTTFQVHFKHRRETFHLLDEKLYSSLRYQVKIDISQHKLPVALASRLRAEILVCDASTKEPLREQARILDMDRVGEFTSSSLCPPSEEEEEVPAVEEEESNRDASLQEGESEFSPLSSSLLIHLSSQFSFHFTRMDYKFLIRLYLAECDGATVLEDNLRQSSAQHARGASSHICDEPSRLATLLSPTFRLYARKKNLKQYSRLKKRKMKEQLQSEEHLHKRQKVMPSSAENDQQAHLHSYTCSTTNLDSNGRLDFCSTFPAQSFSAASNPTSIPDDERQAQASSSSVFPQSMLPSQEFSNVHHYPAAPSSGACVDLPHGSTFDYSSSFGGGGAAGATYPPLNWYAQQYGGAPLSQLGSSSSPASGPTLSSLANIVPPVHYSSLNSADCTPCYEDSVSRKQHIYPSSTAEDQNVNSVLCQNPYAYTLSVLQQQLLQQQQQHAQQQTAHQVQEHDQSYVFQQQQQQPFY